MKPNVYKRKSGRGRIVGHYAIVGPLCTADYTTPQGAAEAAETAVVEALTRLERGAFVFVQQGLVGVVSPDLYGWTSRIIDPAAPSDSSTMSHGTREACVAEMRYHIAQRQWTLACEDDFAYVLGIEGLSPAQWRELLDYFAWQRSYAYLRTQGKSDTDAHRNAWHDWVLLRGGEGVHGRRAKIVLAEQKGRSA
jgi:hypothetical protein